MQIKLDPLCGSEIRALLEEHVRNMYEVSPPDSVHVLDLAALQQPEISFWTLWSGEELMGCGALKELSPEHAEIKSMRTATAHRRKGVAEQMLKHLLTVATQRAYKRLSLETGAQDFFKPARRLYARFGFADCPAFEGYVEDPHSVFMTKIL